MVPNTNSFELYKVTYIIKQTFRRGEGWRVQWGLIRKQSRVIGESDDTSEHGSETVDIFPFVRLVTSTT